MSTSSSSSSSITTVISCLGLISRVCCPLLAGRRDWPSTSHVTGGVCILVALNSLSMQMTGSSAGCLWLLITGDTDLRGGTYTGSMMHTASSSGSDWSSRPFIVLIFEAGGGGQGASPSGTRITSASGEGRIGSINTGDALRDVRDALTKSGLVDGVMVESLVSPASMLYGASTMAQSDSAL